LFLLFLEGSSAASARLARAAKAGFTLPWRPSPTTTRHRQVSRSRGLRLPRRRSQP